MYISASEHYDRLIEMNNDPVYDTEALKQYMDRWDGAEFIDALDLNENLTVLEIGVGTGRLAIKTAPHCKVFVGVDISSKTCKRAKENLRNFKNVTIINGDFYDIEFNNKFNLVYLSLTFMHIKNKAEVLKKICGILNQSGIMVISISKDLSKFLDMGDYMVALYPDLPDKTVNLIENCGFTIVKTIEKEYSYIYVCDKI